MASTDAVQLVSVRAALMALAAAGCASPQTFVVSQPAGTRAPRAATGARLRGAPAAPAALQQDSAAVGAPVCALGAAAALLALRPRRRAGGTRRSEATVVRASSETADAPAATDTAVEEAKAAAQAAKIALEAAQLRAEVEEMERESKAKQRERQAKEIIGDNTIAGLGVAGLPAQLKEVFDLDIDEAQAQAIVEACKPGQPAAKLSLEDVKSDAFSQAFQKVKAEVEEKRREAEIAQREQQIKEAAERRDNEPEEVVWSGEENTDKSVGTKVLACLAYLLPLIDSLPFGIGLVNMVPALMPVFALLAIPAALLNAIPFGTLIVFIAFSALAGNRELPRLVRFNLQQAVLLDIFLFLPQLLSSLVGMVTGGSVATAGANLAIFVLLLIAVAYCCVTIAMGDEPDGLPWVSQAAKRSIDGPGRR
mmetsp:Transcript_55279/g.120467  ORF Transcript_55279/g.120467 Transcript_55279/m.120467 type:complete len:423 (-) Transcript_55279:188-1456(-)